MSRRTRAAQVGACLVVLLAACGRRDPADRAAQPVEAKTVTAMRIESLGLTMDMPEGLARRPAQGVEVFCFEQERDRRYQRCLHVRAVDTVPADVASWTATPMADGGTFAYRSETIEVGSGGPEVHLTGYLQIGGRRFKIQANAAERGGVADAGWCLPIVQSARLASK
jgi:hypothetical protein